MKEAVHHPRRRRRMVRHLIVSSFKMEMLSLSILQLYLSNIFCTVLTFEREVVNKATSFEGKEQTDVSNADGGA